MFNYSLRECTSPETLWVAYNIRYQAYTSVGYESVSCSGLFTDALDGQPAHRTFLLYREQAPVATIRVSTLCHANGWLDLPCKSGFEALIQTYAQQYHALIEMNRMAVLPGVSDDAVSLPMMLFCALYSVAQHFDDVLLCCASGKQHARLYQRMGFERQTEFADRPNAGLPLALMTKSLTYLSMQEDPHFSQLIRQDFFQI